MTNRITTMRVAAMTAAAVAAALFLAACTGHKKDATQSAARVDGTEITVHQINYRLQRERGLRPEQQDAAAHKVLEQLIDEQLLVEKAEKVKMDQQPGAQQALDAARREMLARAYVEQASQTVPQPTEAAVHAYYDGNDALFAHRRIYTLREYLAKVPEGEIGALRAMVDGGKPFADVEAWFKAQGVPFQTQESTLPAERIPLRSLKALSPVKAGQGLLASSGDQVHVTYVASSVDAPATFDKARQAIGQFLAVEARRKVTDSNMAALRTAAKIDYAPQYAALAASAPALATLQDVASTPQPAPPVGTHVSLPASDASSGVQVSLPPLGAQSSVRVSLPTTPASSVQVRLPPQAGGDLRKK